MSNVIAFSPRKGIQEILIKEYQALTGKYLPVKATEAELVEAIKNLSNDSWLIIDHCTDEADLSFIEELNETKILILSQIGIDHKGVQVHKSLLSLFNQLSIVLNQDNPSSGGFFSVPLDELSSLPFAPFNFFMKVADNRYRRCILACEDINHDLISSFEKKGISNLYIEKKYKSEFYNLAGVFQKKIEDL